MASGDVLFTIQTPLAISIRTTKEYWHVITTVKHPKVAKYTKQAQEALKIPDEIRQSTQDPKVHLYYKNIGTVHMCVVADHIDEQEGYIITAYLTDRIKEGVQIYVKKKD